MNRTIYYILITSILSTILFISGCKSGQLNSSTQEQKTLIKEKIESQNFTFIAKSATPMSFKSITLTSLYTLSVSRDTIQSHLPYFGRAYAAPLNTTDGGITFTSTKFTYEVKAKKDTWNITIKPQDNKEVRQLTLSISSSGYATLYVIQDTKQSISFYGTIE